MNAILGQDLIKKAWDTFKSKPGLLIGAALGYFLLNSLVNVLVKFISDALDSGFLASLMSFLGFLLSIVIAMAWFRLLLAVYDNKELSFSTLFDPNLLIFYVVTYFLYVLILVGGLILLIIPGLIWGVMFAFCHLLVLDRGLSPLDALKTSAQMTHGHKWQIFGFLIVLAFINLIGLLFLGVGLLVSIPVSFLAFVGLYRTLSQQKALPSSAI